MEKKYRKIVFTDVMAALGLIFILLSFFFIDGGVAHSATKPWFYYMITSLAAITMFYMFFAMFKYAWFNAWPHNKYMLIFLFFMLSFLMAYFYYFFFYLKAKIKA